jgi:seryl-tRNA synthetase
MRTERLRHDLLAGASPLVVDGVRADLAFCHPSIARVVSIDARDGTVTLALHDGVDASDLPAQLEQAISSSVASYRFVRPPPPIWTRPARAGAYDGREAIARFVAGHVRALGEGQVALTGAAARLRSIIDARLGAIAAEVGAEAWHLPSVERTVDLIPRTGYLVSHPQHVTFCYRLPRHFDRIRRFAAGARERRLTAPADPRDLEPTGFILEPVVCHNVYRALAGSRLDRPLAVTAQGACYRDEGHRFAPLLRQWEFSMREVVVAGPPAFVRELRDRCLALTRELVDDWDLAGELEVATDPFFASEAASARTFQAVQSTKLELRLELGGGDTVAAASFNLHGRHFTQAMDIRDDRGELVETACVGWGLERWIAAFVARHGEDEARWPEAR